MNTDLIGGAQLATITLRAPTSFAICTISLEVVPRTIESVASLQLPLELIEGLVLTVYYEYVFSRKLQSHSVQFPPYVLTAWVR